MDYDKMTIELLAHDIHVRSGFKINAADIESRIRHLCEKYSQQQVKNTVDLGSVSCVALADEIFKFNAWVHDNRYYLSGKVYYRWGEDNYTGTPTQMYELYLSNK
eukprot:GHVU01214819.1.p2 GENE.GHVU01214819.1~~GHVU01214819.1.p2  ORF type:complete len:105 (-),score=7.39 GHVU01214819.1:825-1139(-)